MSTPTAWPERRRHRGPMTTKARREFLEALRAGWSIRHAAERAGRHRRRFYELRAADPEFAEAWRDAVDEATDALEQVVFERAVRGIERPVVSKGEIIGTQVEYDVRRELAVLAARRPEKWSQGRRLEVSGPAGGPIMVEGRPVVGLADVVRLARELGQAHLFGLQELPAGDVVEGEAEEATS